MPSNETKEPDFFPFRLKDHGWVLKKGVPIDTIGEAFREIVYQLVTKDFQKGSVAEAMYNDAIEMMKARSDKARNAANARWKTPQEAPPGTPTPQKASTPSSIPDNKEEVIDFAREHNLDVDDCVECWEATIERGGKDAEGKKITNWWGFMMQWATTRGLNRRIKEKTK